MRSGRRVSLRLKVVALLMGLGLAPLLASALLIRPMVELAQNFASHEADMLAAPLRRAQASYLDSIHSKKRSYELMTQLVADSEQVRQGDREAIEELSQSLLAKEPNLLAVRVVDTLGDVLYQTSRKQPGPGGASRYQPFETRAEQSAGGTVELTFAADLDAVTEYRNLGLLLDDTTRVERFRGDLPRSFQLGFVLLVGVVVVISIGAGILLTNRFTRRIAALVSGTRQVASGDLAARVNVSGTDELGELAGAFNRMVEDLERERTHILYLQRIGAWQDVARRLAHEIKNPLTPIQLAVQNLCSSYRGEDDKHRALLTESAEIVGEEIANLRRLVDAFSSLGRLPPAEPKPLDLATVVEDLTREPHLAEHLSARPSDPPAIVAGDRLLLRRLLSNLVENAIQAGGGKPVVVAWTRDDDSQTAVVTIDDAGPGVPADQRQRIFEPYVTSKDTGTGLGLAIAKKIALDHRGDLILADQPAEAGGARFVLTVPLAPPS